MVDRVVLNGHMQLRDQARLAMRWSLDKFRDPLDHISKKLQQGKISLLDARRLPGFQEHMDLGLNLALNQFYNNLGWPLIVGTATTPSGLNYGNVNARIGVGDSSTAAAATQTGIQAATNKFFQGVDATFPTTGTSQQATWQSTFGTTVANFVWNELSVDANFVASGSSATFGSNTALNRLVNTNMGTKGSAASWVAQCQITGS